jgi:hypothetical protein
MPRSAPYPSKTQAQGSRSPIAGREVIDVIRRPAFQGVFAIACAFVFGGCSAGGNGRQAAVHGGEPIWLSPDPAFAGAQIAVVFKDPNLRPERCRYEWRRNGSVIPQASANALEPACFAKGDRVEVAVVDPGTGPGNERRLHANVRVVNTPPTILRVTVIPATTLDRAEFRAIPESLDRDGDSLTYAYRWLRNGTLIEAGTGPSLPMDSLAPGEQIAVEVVASDGESESPPVRGEAAPIQNRPPRFTSQPMSPDPADGVFRYRAVASHEGQDPLRYELASGPSGMVVNPDGNVFWTVPSGAGRRGEYAVTIRALDSKGDAATQQFTVRLNPPVAKR